MRAGLYVVAVGIQAKAPKGLLKIARQFTGGYIDE
jgi:hypothetical protein